MHSFEILREEHYCFERTMKVLNKFILLNDFSARFFFDFFSIFYKLIITHLKKDQILLAHLPIEFDAGEREITSFSDTTSLDKTIRKEIEAAKDSFEEKDWLTFSGHIEEFIFSLSQHIFQQEEGILAGGYVLSAEVDKRLCSLFDNCYPQPEGKNLWSSFSFLLNEMERIV